MSQAPQGNEDFQLVPPGTHLAMCCTVAFLGFHNSEYKGKKSVKAKVSFTWELVNEQMTDGRPFTISKVVTSSLHAKAEMRKLLETWRSRPFTDEELRGFDIVKVLNKPCLVSIIHAANAQGEIKARLQAVSSLPKGTFIPAMHNAPLYYSVEKGDPDSCDILMLPKWMQDMIATKVTEPKGKAPDPVAENNDADEDVPF